MPARDLLAEALSEGEGAPQDAQADGGKALVVNARYAAGYEERKRKKELARLSARAAERDDDSSSDSEEEDEGEVDPETEAQFTRALTAIRAKDAALYDSSNAKDFFSQPKPRPKAGKVDRPVYLKDAQARALLEDGAEAAAGENGGARGGGGDAGPTYNEQQRDVKSAFLKAGGGFGGGGQAESGDSDSDEEDMFTLNKVADRPETQGGSDDEGAAEGGEGLSQRQADLLASFFGKEDDMDADERFLKDYITNKGWVDREEGGGAASRPRLAELGEDDSEDERELEEAEEFENAYNFRFEEPAGAQLVAHAREQSGVRKDAKKERRKEARQRKQERKQKERRDAVEELKRLKALKRQALEARMTEILASAGAGVDTDGATNGLGEEFDPAKHDRHMAEMFGDQYYDAEDEDFNPDAAGKGGKAMKKPEAGLDDIPAYGEDEDEDDDDDENVDDDEGEGEDEEGGGGGASRGGAAGGGAAAARQAIAEARAQAEADMDGLHFDDVIGGSKTRFRYRQVAADYGGLTAEEILFFDDKELNQIVGMKRLAPYRRDKLKANTKALRNVRRGRDPKGGRREGDAAGGRPKKERKKEKTPAGAATSAAE